VQSSDHLRGTVYTLTSYKPSLAIEGYYAYLSHNTPFITLVSLVSGTLQLYSITHKLHQRRWARHLEPEAVGPRLFFSNLLLTSADPGTWGTHYLLFGLFTLLLVSIRGPLYVHRRDGHCEQHQITDWINRGDGIHEPDISNPRFFNSGAPLAEHQCPRRNSGVLCPRHQCNNRLWGAGSAIPVELREQQRQTWSGGRNAGDCR